jgi:hypothetical protein
MNFVIPKVSLIEYKKKKKKKKKMATDKIGDIFFTE